MASVGMVKENSIITGVSVRTRTLESWVHAKFTPQFCGSAEVSIVKSKTSVASPKF